MMTKVPTLLVLALILLASGCRDKIAPGAYSGSLTTVATLDGALGGSAKDSGLRTVVFGNSGLPVNDGREVFVGQTVMLGLSASAEVTSVFAAGAAVTVEYAATIRFGDDGVLFTGTMKDTYTLVGRNRVAVIFHSETSTTSAGGATLRIVSDGTVIKNHL